MQFCRKGVCEFIFMKILFKTDSRDWIIPNFESLRQRPNPNPETDQSGFKAFLTFWADKAIL